MHLNFIMTSKNEKCIDKTACPSVHAPRKHLRLRSRSDLTMTIGATSWRQLYPRFKKHKSYPPIIEKIFSSFPITWFMPYFHSSPLKTCVDFDFLLLKGCRKNSPEYALTTPTILMALLQPITIVILLIILGVQERAN